MAKMEGKIRELEAELAATQSRSGGAMKAFQRAERKAKELNFAQTEDKKNQVPQGPAGAGECRGESQARHGPLNLMFILNLSLLLINPPKMLPSLSPTLKLK